MVKTNYHKYISRVSKLACGKSIAIPGYATVKAYKCMKTMKRKFSISDVDSALGIKAGGNLSLSTIKSDLDLI